MALFAKIARPVLQRNLFAASSILSRSASDAVKVENATNADAITQSTKNSLLISGPCIKQLRKICKDGTFLRITVEGGGCSGFQYKFDLDKTMNEDDLTFGDDQAKVVIDNISLEYCTGATVDYHEELIRSGFRIVANPLAEQGCSCGSSFAIKLD